MSIPLTVDRCLDDKAMDHIDHALGRPLDPMADTYRNFFAANADGDEAASFGASPHWQCHGTMASSGLVGFSVTPAGRAALRDHLRAIGDKHRAYAVTYDGYTSQVVATSRSRARYSHWAKLSDALSDLSFAKYCRDARVRLVQRKVES